jgi:hypothetical protein
MEPEAVHRHPLLRAEPSLPRLPFKAAPPRTPYAPADVCAPDQHSLRPRLSPSTSSRLTAEAPPVAREITSPDCAPQSLTRAARRSRSALGSSHRMAHGDDTLYCHSPGRRPPSPAPHYSRVTTALLVGEHLTAEGPPPPLPPANEFASFARAPPRHLSLTGVPRQPGNRDFRA